MSTEQDTILSQDAPSVPDAVAVTKPEPSWQSKALHKGVPATLIKLIECAPDAPHTRIHIRSKIGAKLPGDVKGVEQVGEHLSMFFGDVDLSKPRQAGCATSSPIRQPRRERTIDVDVEVVEECHHYIRETFDRVYSGTLQIPLSTFDGCDTDDEVHDAIREYVDDHYSDLNFDDNNHDTSGSDAYDSSVDEVNNNTDCEEAFNNNADEISDYLGWDDDEEEND